MTGKIARHGGAVGSSNILRDGEGSTPSRCHSGGRHATRVSSGQTLLSKVVPGLLELGHHQRRIRREPGWTAIDWWTVVLDALVLAVLVLAARV